MIAGQRVLVTGAARGIGAALARTLASGGARLALVGLEPELLAALAGELGPQHTWTAADVRDSSALDAAVASAVAHLGGLDVVVANAGVATYGTVRDADPAAFARTVDVNLTGVFRTVHATLPHVVASCGYVLVVASVASFTPLPGSSSYAASKAGVDALAASLALEVRHLGVRVGSAHPSWIDTDMVRGSERDLPAFAAMRARLPWPVNGTTTVEECARALARGIDRRARRVYVPGPVALLRLLRGTGLAEVAQRRTAVALVPQLEAEVRSLGGRSSYDGDG